MKPLITLFFAFVQAPCF